MRWLTISNVWLACLLSMSAHARTFTDTQGRALEAEIVSFDGGASVEIRRNDGQVFKLPLNRLSADDQAYVRSWKPVAEQPIEQSEIDRINQLLGIELLADGNLWDDDPAEVARRLGWPVESKTETQSSYRKYHASDDRIAGARPFSSALYGRGGQVDMLSIVFANQGDSVGNSFALDEREMKKAVEQAIEQDGDAIAQKLSALGEPEQLTTASGRNMKERLKLYKWRDHVFALAVQDEQYVALRIMPAKLVANRGRPERISSSEIRSLSQANVAHRPNGDVIITNIPMVDQGPKGYCVPATLERVLRYMGVRADMYLLAMAGQTQIGGGTYVSELIDGTESYVASSGREMKAARIKMKVRDISKVIDSGQPILWSMSSTPEFNAATNAFTKLRSQYPNAEDLERAIDEKMDSAPELKADFERGHVCLIIGYNAATEEIAVSDSWGPEYSERWVPAELAGQVSSGGFWIVDF